MAQTNLIVTYSPAGGPNPRPAGYRPPSYRGGWGIALAGALLTGGAIAALGHFVRPDGTVREGGLERRSDLAPPATGSATPVIPPPVAQRPAGAEPNAQPSPLPYLAVVRDLPRGERPVATRRPLSAAVTEAAQRAAPPRAHSLTIATPAPRAASAAPAEPRDVAQPPSQRRDLAGLLEAQGLVPADPDLADAGLAPVAAWTPEDLSGEASLVPPDEPDADAGWGMADPAPAPAEADSAALLPPPVDPAEPRVTALAENGASPISTSAAAESQPAMALAEPGDTAKRAMIASVPPVATGSAAPPAAVAQHYPLAIVDGEPIGAITLQDLGHGGHAVHLGALVELLKLRMPQAEFARLSSAAAADTFVSLDQLRAAGITVQYDPRQERLLIDAR
jgi:hypothetical protein